MRRMLHLLIVFMLTSCANDPELRGSGSQGSARFSPDSERVYKELMARYRDYETLGQMRVMAACIQDDGKKSSARYNVRRVFVSYTADYSDVPVFPGDLKRDAMNRCQGWVARGKSGCKCQMVDYAGKNLLDLK